MKFKGVSKFWQFIKHKKRDDFTLFSLETKTYRNIKTGVEPDIVVLNSRDAVNVICLDTKKRIVLVHQHRFGTDQETIELPGGQLDEGEDALTAAKRELKEETGFVSEEWTYLGKSPSNPVFVNSYIHHYLAKESVDTGVTSFDPAEYIIIEKYDIKMVEDMLRQGDIDHPHAIAAFSKCNPWKLSI